jgi:hypothetical protein
MIVRAKEKEMKITAQFGDELSEATLRSILQSDFFAKIPNLRRDSREIIKSEFVILMLHLMGKVHEKDILLATKIFDKLDRQCDGTFPFSIPLSLSLSLPHYLYLSPSLPLYLFPLSSLLLPLSSLSHTLSLSLPLYLLPLSSLLPTLSPSLPLTPSLYCL